MQSKILNYFIKKYLYYYDQIKPFGLIMFFNYPFFHFLFQTAGTLKYQNLALRLFLSTLCIPLIFIDKWSSKFFKTSIFYWHTTIILCIPFFFTYMTLMNQVSTVWLMNAVSATFFMLLILDIVLFFVDLLIGVTLGAIIFYILGQDFIINPGVIDIFSLTASFMAAIIIGSIFSHNKFMTERERIKTLESFGGAIAHEMRTPLANVLMGASVLKRTAQRMEQAVDQDDAQKNHVLKEESQDLFKLSERLGRIAKGGQNFINLLLTNLRQDFKQISLTPLSMKKCLHTVMEEYVFRPHEREKIHLSVEKDFTFQGNEEFIIHVFFNLLKNSLYFIQAIGKGEIFITVDATLTDNQVIFKDTGPGIEPHRLGHLFKPFYSKRPHGTGIGLSFCKKAVESMGGRIEVSAIFGQETTFRLYLPKSKEINANINRASLT